MELKWATEENNTEKNNANLEILSLQSKKKERVNMEESVDI